MSSAHRYSPAQPTNAPRSSYPSFLSFGDTLGLHVTWSWRGFRDAFRWNLVVQTVTGDAEIQANVLKSLLLNSLSLTSIYIFDLLLLPLVRDQRRWLYRNVGWFYQILWLLPVVGVSFYLNSSWCTLIAKRTYALRHGSRSAAAQQPVTYTGLLNSLATSAYRVVMVFTSVVISFSLSMIPFVGPFVGFMFLSWIDSYYCFEFIWIARGHSLSRRVRHLEEHWAYYLGFGLPSAALCTWGGGLANAAIFALIFPAYIIMAMHSHPVPSDPYNPVTLASQAQDSTQHPSPFIPIRLPIFAVVIWMNDTIVRILSVGGRRPSGTPGKREMGHSRMLSEAVEFVEEGEFVELSGVGASQRGTPRSGFGRFGRRKAD